ncbi:MAG: hypothetical protein CMP61_05175 [Flavobacteriales bacterium]|nr:hypothetical protein [Flavobacteriales bacterium]
MAISRFPGLRILVVVLFGFLSAHFFGLPGVLLSFIFFAVVLLIFKVEARNVLVFFIVLVLVFLRVSIQNNDGLCDNCYRITKVFGKDGQTQSCWAEGRSKILLKVSRDAPKVMKNDVWHFSSKRKVVNDPQSLEGFIYVDYLKENGIDSFAFLNKETKMIYRDSASFAYFTLCIKQKLIDYYLSFQSISPSTKGVLIALITGDKSYLTREYKSLFSETGVVHVLAISGLHVGILFLTLSFFFHKVLRFPPKLVFFCISFCLFSYAFISGLSPSVIRAVLMFVLIQFGHSFTRQTETLNIVFISCSLMLFYNPTLWQDIGFQLSYSAVIGIVLIVQYSWLSNFNYKGFNFLLDLIKVNIGAFLFTMPILSYHFGVVNFTSVPASLITVPIVSVAMYLGVFLTLSFSFTPLGKALFQVFEFLMNAVEVILSWMAEQIPLLVDIRFSLWGVVCWFCIMLLGLLVQKRFLYFAFLSACIWVLVPNSLPMRVLSVSNGFELKVKKRVYFLQVGDVLELNDVRVEVISLVKICIDSPLGNKRLNFNVDKYQTLSVRI